MRGKTVKGCAAGRTRSSRRSLRNLRATEERIPTVFGCGTEAFGFGQLLSLQVIPAWLVPFT